MPKFKYKGLSKALRDERLAVIAANAGPGKLNPLRTDYTKAAIMAINEKHKAAIVKDAEASLDRRDAAVSMGAYKFPKGEAVEVPEGPIAAKLRKSKAFEEVAGAAKLEKAEKK